MREGKFIVGMAVCAITLSASAGAPGADQSTDVSQELSQLRDTVSQMQERIDELEAGQGDNWMTEARADEVRGLVADVLSDADTRSSLLQNGSLAGWNNGFYLGSADGNFHLKIGGQLQVRWVYNNRDMPPGSDLGGDENRHGFEMRRVRLLFSGHIVDPSWTYDIQINQNRSGGTFFLEDFAYIQKDLGGGWRIRAGQMKAPFLREEMLSSIRMLPVERTLVNSSFTAGTVQGVMVWWNNEDFRAYGMYHDGDGSANTAWSMEDTEYAFTARGEWKAAGDWNQFNDWSGFPDEDFGVLVGAAVNYNEGEYGTGMNLPAPDFNNLEVENLGFTVDAMIDFSGASIGGALVYRNLKAGTGVGSVDLEQIGFFVRGGYFITEDWEIYGQYEWADLDIAGLEDLSVITVGVTKYWAKHNLKWQTDIGFGLNDVNAVANPLMPGSTVGFANDGAGWRTDTTGNDGQMVIRSQLQLVF